MAGRATRDLTEGPVFGHILRMLVPMSFGIVAMMLTGVIDTYWVGTLGTSQQAAVQLSFPVTMLVMSISIGLGAGAVSVVSRAAGEKDDSIIRRTATDALSLSVLAVGFVSILGVIFVEPLFRLIGASDTMIPHVIDYMTVWFSGIVLIVGPMVASNILRALGNAVLPSIMMIAAAVVNMILDPFFILDEFLGLPGLGWGVSGAALATVAANAVTFVMIGSYLVFREKLIDFRWHGLGELVHNWGEIARVGLPAAASNTFNPFALTIVMGGLGMAQFGDAAVGGVGVAARLEAFAIVPLFALSASIGPVTGQNGGAGITSRVREAFAKSFLFCLVWSLSMAVIILLLSRWLAPAFLPSEMGQQVAQTYWSLVTLTIAGYGISMAASAGFNGLGRPSFGVMITSSRALMMAVLAVSGGIIFNSPAGVIGGVAIANILSGAGTATYVLFRAPMEARKRKQRKAAAPANAASE
ncbi:MATE family efflux transporter [Hyphobacterium sp. HN65]|uniref:MATE family efflux transporter n=1 Tax=Hyphobacterium lacteum TaxID=3116575 RepID=A0ABU7LLP4_9PROT|nr:MATE family efflux transporter [Hyphobacterium sp. HN65]MEE2524850.1 MATE family efflux transporter [Hyphobacterium sp. HN65]